MWILAHCQNTWIRGLLSVPFWRNYFYETESLVMALFKVHSSTAVGKTYLKCTVGLSFPGNTTLHCSWISWQHQPWGTRFKMTPAELLVSNNICPHSSIPFHSPKVWKSTSYNIFLPFCRKTYLIKWMKNHWLESFLTMTMFRMKPAECISIVILEKPSPHDINETLQISCVSLEWH